MKSLGIDVGGSSVKLALVDGDKTVWQTQSETYSNPTRQQLADAIRKSVAGRFERGSAVGICVPGRRDASGRTVLLSVNIPALNNLKLDDLVAESLDAPPGHVEPCSDQTAAAFDIYATHQLKGRLLSIALGTGTGAAVLDDGVPLRVDGESPGHLGQMDCSIEGEPVIGPDGGAGSLEGYIGAPALTRKYGPDMAANLARLTADDAPLQALARAIRICHAMYCMDHVALTGGLGNRMHHLVPIVRQLVEKDLTSIAKKGWTLRCGDDDFHAAKGAAKFAAAQAAARSR
jgi:predicted NBD/HSP70 family sugar kinase